MNQSVVGKIQAQIEQPLLIKRPENLAYLVGHDFIDDSFLLIAPMPISESHANRRITTNKKINPGVVLFGGFLEKIPKLKTDRLHNIKRYLGRNKILQVESALSLAESSEIKRLVPKLKLKPVHAAIEQYRLIKTNQELLLMQKAYDLTVKVFAMLKKELAAKVWTEIELARFIKLVGLKFGADDVSFPPIVASGKNSAIPHHEPTSKVIKAGEPVVLDFGFKVDGYCSDFTRTVFLKRAIARFRNLYKAVEQAYQGTINVAVDGSQAKDIDAAARNVLKKAKFSKYFIHSLGHGTGRQVHEAPHLSPHSIDILRNGMVFSIEPGVYLPGQGGIRIEDLVYLKRGKAHYFVKVSTKLTDNILR